MPDFLIPSAPWLSGVIAAGVLGGTWLVLRLFVFTDLDDDDE